MQRNNYQWIVLDTISASAGVVTVKNRVAYIAGLKWFQYDDVQPNSIIKETAITSATAGVITWTVGANPANSATYTISFQQQVPTSATQATQRANPQTFSVTTPATGTPTATTVADQFRTVLAAQGTTYFTGSGTGTLILTANSSYPIISSGAWVRDGSGTASTVTQTTTGINTRGLTAQLQALGASLNTAGAAMSGTKYTIYYKLSFENIGETNTMRVNQGWQTMLAINEDATNYAALITAIDLTLDAFTTGTTINPEVISVSGQ